MTELSSDITAMFTAEGTDAFTVDATVSIGDGETLVVLGPSGSGKTLLLETIAGFHPYEGTVRAGGTALEGVPPEERGFGFVFQDYALFPHMTVRENVEYGTRYHEDTREAEPLLAELGVADLLNRYPPTLSGGEKQRVALARALAINPEVLLLDEPLAALDVPTRQALRDDLADVLADVTAIYVTHNRTTARALADRLVVMRDGGVVQRGTVEDVFERPASPAVARFTGANVVDLSAAPALRDLVGEAADRVAVRPEAVEVGDVGVAATVRRVVREDATSRVTLAVGDVTLDAFAARPPAVGDTVRITAPETAFHPC